MSENIREEEGMESAVAGEGDVSAESGSVDLVEPAGPSTGELLRTAREAAGITVADVARQLKLGVRQIEALEADDHDHLPGPTFVRGFIRNYAKLIQADPEPFLDAYRQAAPQPVEQVIVAQEDQISFSEYEKPPYLKYGAVLIVALIVVGTAFYLWFPASVHTPETPKDEAAASVAVPLAPPSTESLAPPVPAPVSPTPVAPAPPPEPVTTQAAPAPVAPAAPPQPAPTAVTPPAPVPAHGVSVTLEFGGDSWVEAKDKDGKIVFSQLNRANSRQIIQGVTPMELVIGNAGKVKVTYKGQLIDLTPFTRGDSAVARIKLD